MHISVWWLLWLHKSFYRHKTGLTSHWNVLHVLMYNIPHYTASHEQLKSWRQVCICVVICYYPLSMLFRTGACVPLQPNQLTFWFWNLCISILYVHALALNHHIWMHICYSSTGTWGCWPPACVLITHSISCSDVCLVPHHRPLFNQRHFTITIAISMYLPAPMLSLHMYMHTEVCVYKH